MESFLWYAVDTKLEVIWFTRNFCTRHGGLVAKAFRQDAGYRLLPLVLFGGEKKKNLVWARCLLPLNIPRGYK